MEHHLTDEDEGRSENFYFYFRKLWISNPTRISGLLFPPNAVWGISRTAAARGLRENRTLPRAG
jgi:hypothetical protein